MAKDKATISTNLIIDYYGTKSIMIGPPGAGKTILTIRIYNNIAHAFLNKVISENI